jgi:hypothetical protein
MERANGEFRDHGAAAGSTDPEALGGEIVRPARERPALVDE